MSVARWSRALAVAAVTVLAVPAPASADDLPGSLDGVQLRGDRIDAVLTAEGLPDGATIDPGSVTVEVSGESVPASVATADDGTVSRRVVLLVDVSGSMRGAGIDAARRAADAFLDDVPSDVRVGVVAFNDSTRVLAEPTTDRDAVRRVLADVQPTRETALYDAVPVALRVLGDSGARTLLLLSDGGDTVSLGTRETMLAAVRASGARAEVVGFRTDETQDGVLAAVADAGDGRVSQAGDSAALADAFGHAARALTRQVRVSAALPRGVGGEVTLRVVGEAGGQRVVATSAVVLPDAPATVAAGADAGAVTALQPVGSTVVPRPGVLSSPWVVAAAVGAFLLLTTLLVAAPALEPAGRRRTRQLELYSAGRRSTRARTAHRPDGPGQLAQPFLNVAEAVVQRRGLQTGYALWLDRADMALRPHEWLLLRCAVALGAAALLLVLSGWFLAVLGAVAGWLATWAYVRVRARRRLARFAAQLPDALNLVASGIQTGFSLPQALDAVARDTSEPIRVEIGRALAEARLGADVEDALDRTAHRMDNQDLRWAVMAIRVQRQVGGNLAETLRTTVATLRERAALRRQVRALSAEGRLSAYILVALPIGLAAWLYVSNREYVSLLWSTPLGWLMTVVALLGMAVGSFWMSKVVKVEV